MLSASEILNIKEAGELFSDNINEIKLKYSQLAKQWHPDLNSNSKESNEVMANVNKLYNECVEMIRTGTYKKPGVIKLSGVNGNVNEIKYHKSHSFELGTMYVGDASVAFIVDKKNSDLVENAKRTINDFKYANENMEKEISRYLPKIKATFETIDYKIGLIIDKTPDVFLLKDIFNYYDERVSPRHVAWILSSLYNLLCYFDYSGISHNAISLETYFISPKYHSGVLLGGWWYSVNQGEKMIGVPEKIYTIMPPHIKNKKNGSLLTDLESVRMIGRELLGDKNGTKLVQMNDIPLPLTNWLRGTSSSKSALEEYSKWGKVLEESFGERKFIEMIVNKEELYNKNNRR
ncbi:MAG: hypothetical protein K0R54_690 [Clostridiaceae bacterium]|jgi:hypothetical protein|nr:hypothetical protein [Clostridiaceae bacterium]